MTIKFLNLTNLRIARENPRSERPAENIEVMAQSLIALGILHSLVGYEQSGNFHITAGGTRLEAIRALVKSKRVPKDKINIDMIPVNVVEKSQAIDTALTSNLTQSSMSPPDTFKAFYNLHFKENVAIADIAVRYFTDETQVRRMLKLAALAKPIFEAFEKGELSMSLAKIYAGCDNQDRQMTVFTEFGAKATEHRVRSALRECTYVATAACVQFVTLEAYQEAGGKIEEDLFAEEQILLDGHIIDELMITATAAYSETLKKQGWADVTYCDGANERNELTEKSFTQLYPDFEPNKKDAKSHDKQGEILEALQEEHGWGEWNWPDKAKAKGKKAEAVIEAIEARSYVYQKEDMQNGHAFWYMGSNGIEFNGYSPVVQSANGAANKKAKPDLPHPASFEEQVKRTSGHALISHLAHNPHRVSRVMALLALAGKFDGFEMNAKRIRKMKYAHDVPKTEMVKGTNYRDVKIDTRIKRLLALTDEQLDAEFARVLSQFYELGACWNNDAAMLGYKTVAKTVDFNLGTAWSFDADELSALNKKQLKLVMLETKGTDVDFIDKAKKSEAVIVAARYVERRTWTPPFVRTHDLVSASDGPKVKTVKAKAKKVSPKAKTG